MSISCIHTSPDPSTHHFIFIQQFQHPNGHVEFSWILEYAVLYATALQGSQHEGNL